MMSLLSLSCVVFLCLLFHTVADKGHERLLVRKQKGDKIEIYCSNSNSDMENLSLNIRLTKVVQLFYFYKETEKVTIHKRLKSRLTYQNESNNVTITIGNLTIEDSGVYWCVYSAFKKNDIEQDGILLFVNDEDCVQSRGLAMPMTLILVSVVTAGSVLLLSLIILFTWVIPRLKAWRATMRPAPVRTNDVYEQMNNFRRA